MSGTRSILLTALGGVLALIGNYVYGRLAVLGAFRGDIVNIHGLEPLRIISGTGICEDLHREKTTGQLFAACQQSAEQRSKWFPPLVTLTDPTALGDGSIVRIDSVTMTATSLKLKNFDGPLVTHGIDILNDPNDKNILWIYAVNHLPNPERWNSIPIRHDLLAARSQIEIFKHELGSSEATHVRSVRDPAIIMPNDILATSPTSFYVTNDHKHPRGALRTWEDLSSQRIGPIPDTVLVQISDLNSADATGGIQASTALRDIHNNNGLGRASPHTPNELTIVDAAGGVMTRVIKTSQDLDNIHLRVLERIQFDSSLDNPSYYEDEFATPGNNASGYILPGLAHAYKLADDFAHLERPIPSLVWHLRSNGKPLDVKGKRNAWEKRLVFADDGRKLRTASGAVLVGIDPAKNGGKKEGWLFVTGFASLNVVAAKIEL